jgi:hypothetical protein
MEEKIAELKQILSEIIGPSALDMRGDESLMHALSHEDRLAFWMKLQQLDYRVHDLVMRRTWKQFWRSVLRASGYVDPPAIYTQGGSETLEQIANQNLRFNLHDFRQGLWPREAIAARVKQIIAYSMNVPASKVQEHTTFQQLNGMSCGEVE